MYNSKEGWTDWKCEVKFLGLPQTMKCPLAQVSQWHLGMWWLPDLQGDPNGYQYCVWRAFTEAPNPYPGPSSSTTQPCWPSCPGLSSTTTILNQESCWEESITLCREGFVSRNHLKRHMNSHALENSNYFALCGEEFVSWNHLKINTGDDLYHWTPAPAPEINKQDTW